MHYSVNRSGKDTSNVNLPQLQLRTGLTEAMEFHLIWAGWNRDSEEGQPNTNSKSDLVLGSKYRLHQGESSNLTLLGQVWVPTGSSPAGSDSVDPVLGLLYDQMLGDRLQFFANVLAARYEDGGSDYNQKQFTLGLGYGLGPRWGSYIEYFAAYPGIDAVDETSLVDGGFTYNPTPDMQIDISVGVGLRESSSDFVSIGFSFRY